MIHVDQFGQKYITSEDYPNLYAEIQDYCKYAYWHSCCLDEAIYWSNLINANRMFKSDVDSILMSQWYLTWKSERKNLNS